MRAVVYPEPKRDEARDAAEPATGPGQVTVTRAWEAFRAGGVGACPVMLHAYHEPA